MPKALESMIAHIQQAMGNRRCRLSVHGYGNLDTAHELAGRLEKLSSAPVPVVPLPAVLAAHVGLGALGVTINPELNLAQLTQN